MANRETSIWINLAVQDLDRSRAFFSTLGFGFNPKFSDTKAICLVLNEQAFVMLLREEFFEGFTKRQISNPAMHTETMLAFSCSSREEVDALADLALTVGGMPCMEPQDHGFMYARSFYDPDGHHWEAFWMAEGGPE